MAYKFVTFKGASSLATAPFYELGPDEAKADEYVALVAEDGTETKCEITYSDLLNVKAKLGAALCGIMSVAAARRANQVPQPALNARKPAAIAPQSEMPANQSTPRAFQRGKPPAAVPRIFPAFLTLRQTSSITLLSSGSSMRLRHPIEPERSHGPTQMQSRPGTFRILSRFFTASMCSTWQITIGQCSDSFT